MTSASDLYRFKARLAPWGVHGLETWDAEGSAWHDGDTFNAWCSFGRRGYWLLHVRAAGYNAPEIDGPTKATGLVATDYARGLVDTGGIVYLNSIRFVASDEGDHFGRMLAEVTLPDGRDLAELMIAAGYAVAYEP